MASKARRRRAAADRRRAGLLSVYRPPTIAGLLDAFPALEVGVAASSTDDLLPDLKAGEILCYAGTIPGPQHELGREFETVPMHSRRNAIYAAHDHPLFQKFRIDPADLLRRHSFTLYSALSASKDIEECCSGPRAALAAGGAAGPFYPDHAEDADRSPLYRPHSGSLGRGLRPCGLAQAAGGRVFDRGPNRPDLSAFGGRFRLDPADQGVVADADVQGGAGRRPDPGRAPPMTDPEPTRCSPALVR